MNRLRRYLPLLGFVVPTVVDGTDGAFRDGDAVVHVNFRAERARQLDEALNALRQNGRVAGHIAPVTGMSDVLEFRQLILTDAEARSLSQGIDLVLKRGEQASVTGDAALTGAKGLNLWSSFQVPPPQRSTRLYRALVERALASSVFGAALPTEQPFLYTVSVTATEGTALAAVEEAALGELDRVAREGLTPDEVAKAKAQLRARLVFDDDSVTNVAHQLGYFETIASVGAYYDLQQGVASVTVEQVAEAARALFKPSNRTIGWFVPLPSA